MGRVFIENHGSSGSAMLFHRAWNLDYSEAQHRDMMTGKHIVRDVKCRVCHERVGWMYEFAMEESQRYKEARVILEKALIDEEDGFPDPGGAKETHEQPPPPPIYETFGGRRAFVHEFYQRPARGSPIVIRLPNRHRLLKSCRNLSVASHQL